MPRGAGNAAPMSGFFRERAWISLLSSDCTGGSGRVISASAQAAIAGCGGDAGRVSFLPARCLKTRSHGIIRPPRFGGTALARPSLGPNMKGSPRRVTVFFFVCGFLSAHSSSSAACRGRRGNGRWRPFHLKGGRPPSAAAGRAPPAGRSVVNCRELCASKTGWAARQRGRCAGWLDDCVLMFMAEVCGGGGAWAGSAE